ncbi:MAG TPA: glycoside hydrolase family 30 beta sandwich domain-containing protein [Phycisphaerae bacterium]|nr:glycoside hydrolase family 30 beta sandwich domain-containing protein [Phycisphaerae bacterium]
MRWVLLTGGLLAWGACGGVFAAGPVWVCTTAAEPWKSEAAPRMEAGGAARADVVIETRKPLQEIDGFGGCFNELGWEALRGLPEGAREKVLRELFGDEGCGFTLARMPIGASDYAKNWYSLDETPGDLGLKDFSIERDRGCLLHYVKAAMQIRPKLGVWLSAWSPPAWMKTNGEYAGGSLKADRAVQAAYADYLAMAVQAYEGEGVHVYACMVQNEPDVSTTFPTCTWSGEQVRDFIREDMGPTFRRRKVDAGIWLGTIADGDIKDYAAPVLSDPGAAAFVKGAAYQWGGKAAIAETHRRYPALKLMQSETECGDGTNDFAYAEETFGLMRTYLNGGASSYFMWNMVLPPGGESSWGWAQNAAITVDGKTGKVTYNPEFYLFEQVSHFVRPGAHVAASSGTWEERLAFVGADGSAIVVVGNSAEAAREVTIGTDAGEDVVRVTLPGHSLNTLVLPAGDR